MSQTRVRGRKTEANAGAHTRTSTHALVLKLKSIAPAMVPTARRGAVGLRRGTQGAKVDVRHLRPEQHQHNKSAPERRRATSIHSLERCHVAPRPCGGVPSGIATRRSPAGYGTPPGCALQPRCVRLLRGRQSGHAACQLLSARILIERIASQVPSELPLGWATWLRAARFLLQWVSERVVQLCSYPRPGTTCALGTPRERLGHGTT